ncbi:hypothetical protein C8035_v007400 [Colletotrichum spinosum]|uniref:Uncharacterized protein n=1 Tax=Colletotrichum spinosum TaxID=1347390 RepID=A0A4R8PZF8_9PEZI|nr:hypothetical protein C8035_v007400 [Colletotrichum spinosum]
MAMAMAIQSANLATAAFTTQTERSHEENQERAYIAASRRADRSIEARVQSAKMASEIHKKRTGKGFKISEAIVQAEEMYEEEEDDMPRSYRMLASHLQTGSPDFDFRVNAFLANRVAMASMVAGLRNEEWAQNPINKMFAEQFPNANKQAQALSLNLTNSMYYQSVAGSSSSMPQQQPTQHNPVTSPMSPTFGNVNFQPSAQPAASPMDMSTPTPREYPQSPPALSPSSDAAAATPSTRSASTFPSPMATLHESLYPGDSAFTAELPMEAKMMVNLDMGDPMSNMFMGNPLQQQAYYPEMADLKSDPTFTDYGMSTHEYFDGHLNPYAPRYDDRSATATPGPGSSDNWESFLDFGDHNETGSVDPTL